MNLIKISVHIKLRKVRLWNAHDLIVPPTRGPNAKTGKLYRLLTRPWATFSSSFVKSFTNVCACLCFCKKILFNALNIATSIGSENDLPSSSETATLATAGRDASQEKSGVQQDIDPSCCKTPRTLRGASFSYTFNHTHLRYQLGVDTSTYSQYR